MADEKLLEYPPGISNNAHIEFVGYKYSLPKANVNTASYQRKSSGFSCALYVPAGIKDSAGGDWGTEGIPRFAGGGADKVFSSENGLNFMTDVVKGLADKIPGGKQVQAIYAANTGTIINPNEMLILKGGTHYDLNLSYELVPNSEEEGLAVKKIINYFKRNSTPSFETIGGVSHLQYPEIFDIHITSKDKKYVSTKDKNEDILFGYQGMVLIAFDVTYGGGDNSMLYYNDGTPVHATMSLTFKSVRPGR